MYAFRNEDGQYVFSGLKLGKISTRYIVQCILASISEAPGKVIVVMFIILFWVICAIALKAMFEYL